MKNLRLALLLTAILGTFVLIARALGVQNTLQGSVPNADSIFVHGPNAEELVADCAAVNQMDNVKKTVPAEKVSGLSYCMGYLTGIVDLYAVVITQAHDTRANFCVPNGASSTQLAKVVAKYGNDHPEELNKGGVAVAIEAFIQTFPCR
jgi:hypothetical protein